MVHMRTVNSVATPDRESGMAHQRAYLAAVDGKHPVNKASRLAETFAYSRRLAFAVAAFFVASTAVGHAQSGPFAGLAGNWSGGGTITLDDGSRERIRCRASYQVAGAQHDHVAHLRQRRLQVQPRGQCRRSGRPGHRHLDRSRAATSPAPCQGRGGGGNFQVVASTAGFNANISLRTAGNKQTVTMRADSQFRGADISLSK